MVAEKQPASGGTGWRLNLYFVLSVFWRRICSQAYRAESYLQSQRNQTWIHHRHAGSRRLQAEAQVRGPPNLLGSDSGLRDVGLDALTPGPLAGTAAVHTSAMRDVVLEARYFLTVNGTENWVFSHFSFSTPPPESFFSMTMVN